MTTPGDDAIPTRPAAIDRPAPGDGMQSLETGDPQILFIAPEAEDRDNLRQRLEEEFPRALYVGTDDAERAWNSLFPAVTVFACHDLAEAESTYLALLKSGPSADVHRHHQAIVLCRIDETEAAYGRCRKRVFDDYAVFKPLHDGWRIHQCLRRALDLYRASVRLDDPARAPAPSPEATPPQTPAGPAPGLDSSTDSETGAAPDRDEDTRTVLVVEDEPFTQAVYREVLESNGYAVHMIGDGNLVMEAVTRQLPDAILMDINLPTLNGVEATRLLRGHGPTENTPVIVVTGHRDRSTVEACINAGANAYIVKPIEEDKLLAKLRKLLPANP